MHQPSLPLPGSRSHAVVAAAPGPGPHRWAGAPSAAVDADGSVVLAYRVRGDDDHNVIARSVDGEHFTTVGLLRKELFGASMLERPALVRLDDGAWRLRVLRSARLASLVDRRPAGAHPGGTARGAGRAGAARRRRDRRQGPRDPP